VLLARTRTQQHHCLGGLLWLPCYRVFFSQLAVQRAATTRPLVSRHMEHSTQAGAAMGWAARLRPEPKPFFMGWQFPSPRSSAGSTARFESAVCAPASHGTSRGDQITALAVPHHTAERTRPRARHPCFLPLPLRSECLPAPLVAFIAKKRKRPLRFCAFPPNQPRIANPDSAIAPM
jgi:hypothetical protein